MLTLQLPVATYRFHSVKHQRILLVSGGPVRPLRVNNICVRARRPIRPALISSFRSMKRLGVFILPPGWYASPWQGYTQHYAGTHLYTWVERGTVRVKCLAQEHNTMSPAKPQTRITRARSLDPESNALTMRPPRLPH